MRAGFWFWTFLGHFSSILTRIWSSWVDSSYIFPSMVESVCFSYFSITNSERINCQIFDFFPQISTYYNPPYPPPKEQWSLVKYFSTFQNLLQQTTLIISISCCLHLCEFVTQTDMLINRYEQKWTCVPDPIPSC